MKGKIITSLIVVVVFLLVFNYINKLRVSEVNTINEDFSLSKGIVIDKSVYKGRTIRVKYFINGRQYIGSDGISESDKVMIGDTIAIKYSLRNHELMITQFNEKF